MIASPRLLTLSLLAAGLAIAVGSAAPRANVPSPYAGEQGRPIKALSAQDTDDLLAGKGMGLAKAAELNAYPGPAHVLALKDELKLTPQQVAQTQALMAAMSDQAKALGARIVALESELDRRFAMGHIEEQTLRGLTGEIGRLQGELRAVHLGTHLQMKALLSEQQVAAYGRLRGYDQAAGSAAPAQPSMQGHTGHSR